MKARIERCSHPGAWWARWIGREITVLWTDSCGHWTRDTHTPGAQGWAGYPFLQWIDPKDTSPTYAGRN